MKQSTLLIWATGILVALLFLTKLPGCYTKNPIVTDIKKTDTVIIYKPFKPDTSSNFKNQLPSKITIYNTPDKEWGKGFFKKSKYPGIDSKFWICTHSDYPTFSSPSDYEITPNPPLPLLTDSPKYFLEDTSTKYSYYWKFPKSPKLVMGKFTRDSLNFSLLNADGKIYTYEYPVNYSEYRYEWYNNSLRKIQVRDLSFATDFKKPKPFYTESNLYVGINPFNSSPTASIDYSLMYKKVGLYSRLGIYNNRFNTDLGVRIKLK